MVMYSFCPRKYFYRYIKCIKEPPTPHMVRGRMFHRIIERFFEEEDIMKNIPKNLGWKDQAHMFELVFFAILEQEWDKIGSADYPDTFESVEQKSEFYEQTKEFLEFYAYKLAYALAKKKEELDSESQYYELDIKRHFYPKHREQLVENDNMKGFIDKVVGLFGKGVAIIDIKTSKVRLPDFIDRSHLLQLKAYAYLWLGRTGDLPRFVAIEYVRNGSTVFYPITLVDMEEVEALISELNEKKQSGDIELFPKKEGKLCGWCFYKGMCDGEKKT